MNNSILKTLLKEYEQKKIHAELELEEKKQELFSSNKTLEKIENSLNKCGVELARATLSSNKNLIEELNQKILDFKKEKEQLLNNLNIDLTPNYECKICSDTGFISENGKTILCNCIKQKIFDIQYNKSNLTNLDKDTFKDFNLYLYSDEPNEKLFNSKVSPRENIKLIKKISEDFIDNFDNQAEKNLLFTGNTGLGKTYLSNCIANELLKKGKTVLYQTAPVLFDTIIDYRFGKNNVPDDFYENILNVDLLIIDDLGTECMNSMKFTELFNIINTRLLNQNSKITKTIISTNLTLKNMFDTYDERIISRFVGYYNICKFYGDDLRFKK